MILINVEELE